MSFFSSKLIADELLGIEANSVSDTPAEGEDPQTGYQQQRKEREQEEQEQEQPEPRRAREGGGLSLSGGLQVGSDSYGGQLTVGYGLNPYLGIDTQGFYSRYAKGKKIDENYGGELDVVLRYPNASILTPFVGAGPGYIKWRRENNDVMFDDGSSITGNAFVGLHIRLAKNFGLQGMRKQTTYLGARPVLFDDTTSHEKRTQITNSIGFFVSF